MNIMFTGNMGYVGSVTVSHIRKVMPDAVTVGVDSGLFTQCIGQDDLPERFVDIQIFRDVRHLSADLFDGIDAVLHLAAISNEPMGSCLGKAIEESNQKVTIRLTALAAESGVEHFTFSEISTNHPVRHGIEGICLPLCSSSRQHGDASLRGNAPREIWH